MENADELQEMGPWGQAVAYAFRFLFIAVCVIAAGWFLSNVREIPADSQAVVTRFGSVARVAGSGLLIAMPKPIERITVVPASARQIALKIERLDESVTSDDTTGAGYGLSRSPRLNTGFLLTGDSNIIHLDAQLFYQVSDPVAYMIAQDHVRPALERIFIACAIAVIGRRDLDSVLVARPELASRPAQSLSREELRGDMLKAINERLSELAGDGIGLGVTASRVDLLPTIPGGAKSAFDNVLVAAQSAETAIANARTAAQQTSSDANSKKDKIATDATATTQEIVTNAKTATATITALGQSANGMSRSMQLSQIYYDRIQPILKKAGSIEVVDSGGIVHTILPDTDPPKSSR
jgi:regulator of protease activity HflC (stomatin/prohibitin superfamily)